MIQRLGRGNDRMGSVLAQVEISCAVEVFIATALLQKECPGRPEFTIREILDRAGKEGVMGEPRPGVNVHISQHCVANKTPNPAKHRMLFATGKHTRRLLLPGDEVHPDRTGKIFPEAGELPERYLPLLEWAKQRYEQALGAGRPMAVDADEWVRRLREDTPLFPGQVSDDDLPEKRPRHLEGLLQARGIGAEMAKGIDPDEYIRSLREGWE
jgi:hypothetical protein